MPQNPGCRWWRTRGNKHHRAESQSLRNCCFDTAFFKLTSDDAAWGHYGGLGFTSWPPLPPMVTGAIGKIIGRARHRVDRVGGGRQAAVGRVVSSMAPTNPTSSVWQTFRCAWILALPKAGRSKAARIPMMAMTTSISINVKAFREARGAGNFLINIASPYCNVSNSALSNFPPCEMVRDTGIEPVTPTVSR
jgi:hypothetical protein